MSKFFPSRAGARERAERSESLNRRYPIAEPKKVAEDLMVFSQEMEEKSAMAERCRVACRAAKITKPDGLPWLIGVIKDWRKHCDGNYGAVVKSALTACGIEDKEG